MSSSSSSSSFSIRDYFIICVGSTTHHCFFCGKRFKYTTPLFELKHHFETTHPYIIQNQIRKEDIPQLLSQKAVDQTP